LGARFESEGQLVVAEVALTVVAAESVARRDAGRAADLAAALDAA